MKIIDLIFYRLLFLYRKEGKDAIDSASNYLTAILLVVITSLVGTIVNIVSMPENGWREKVTKPILFLIVAPVFIILSYLIKRYYKKRVNYNDVISIGTKLKFSLFSLYIVMLILVLLPFILPKFF